MLNLDSRSRAKLLWVGTLLIPALAVQGVRFGFGASPASASAATGPALAAAAASVAPVPAPEAAKPLSPAQAKAIAWILSRKQTLNQRSPMDRPDSIAELASSPSPMVRAGGPTSESAPKPAGPVSPSGMTLTGLFSSGSDGKPVILINHRLYHVGDEIVPNWRILSVDVDSRTVRIAGPDGQNIDLSLAGSDR